MLIKLASKISNGIEKFTFGKYRDKSVKYVMRTDIEYIKWVKKNTNKNFSQDIEKEIKRLKL